ncbi:DMT family transporter [Streptomyces albidoflavus]|uniref:DMT family transporter n=1 Tax=Streptomyces albidoflavus TaxID=1886 RepID=UPI0034002B06
MAARRPRRLGRPRPAGVPPSATPSPSPGWAGCPPGRGRRPSACRRRSSRRPRCSPPWLPPWGGPPPRAPGAVPVLALLVLGIFATGVTCRLTYRMILAEGPTQAPAVGYLLPVVSVLPGAVVLGERVRWRVVAGMAVVLGGVVLTRWGAGARPKAPAGDEGERPEPLPAR